jgi:hypothetical protein
MRRTNEIALGLSAIIAGVLIYFLIQGIDPNAPAEDYGPDYDKSQSAQAQSVASQQGSTGSQETTDTQRTEDQGTRAAQKAAIVGRVLDTHDRPVVDVRVHCIQEDAPTATALSTTPDAKGYFRFEPPEGLYRIIARAPGHCMFPAQARRAVPGDSPVRIYMHPMILAKLRVIDRTSRTEIALPYGTEVIVKVDGVETPENPRLAVASEVWSDKVQDLGLSIGRSSIRVLGSAIKFDDNSKVEFEVSSPGLVIDSVEVPMSSVRTADSAVTLLADAQAGWSFGSVAAAYDSGHRFDAPLIVNAKLSDDTRLQYWGLEEGRPTLLTLKPGSAVFEVGLVTCAMQEVSVTIPDEPYPTVPLPVVRGGDLKISMTDPNTGLHCAFGDVEIDVARGKRYTEYLNRNGVWSKGSPYQVRNVPVGRYFVRAEDSAGKVHKREVEITKEQLADIVFRASR